MLLGREYLKKNIRSPLMILREQNQKIDSYELQLKQNIKMLLAENKQGPHLKRICGLDTYIPLGAAANLVLIQEQDIEEAAIQLMEVSS